MHMQQDKWFDRAFDYVRAKRNYFAAGALVTGVLLSCYSIQGCRNLETRDEIDKRYASVSRAHEIEQSLDSNVKRGDTAKPGFVEETRQLADELKRLHDSPDFEGQKISYEIALNQRNESDNNYGSELFCGAVIGLIGLTGIKSRRETS